MYKKGTSKIIILCLVVVLIALAGVVFFKIQADKIAKTTTDFSYSQAESSNEEVLKSQKTAIEVKNKQIQAYREEKASLYQQINNPLAKPTSTTTTHINEHGDVVTDKQDYDDEYYDYNSNNDEG
ncbi:MAG: hypothetical protein KBT46_09535 [Ruminococcus sp.]|nr:hypothetical protein [Candidatus Copronaster equi]